VKTSDSDGAHRLEDDRLLRDRAASLTLAAYENRQPFYQIHPVRSTFVRVRHLCTSRRNVRERGWPRCRYRLLDHADRDAICVPAGTAPRPHKDARVIRARGGGFVTAAGQFPESGHHVSVSHSWEFSHLAWGPSL